MSYHAVRERPDMAGVCCFLLPDSRMCLRHRGHEGNKHEGRGVGDWLREVAAVDPHAGSHKHQLPAMLHSHGESDTIAYEGGDGLTHHHHDEKCDPFARVDKRALAQLTAQLEETLVEMLRHAFHPATSAAATRKALDACKVFMEKYT